MNLKFKGFFLSVVFVFILSALVFVLVKYYSVIFSKTVVGEVLRVERVEPPLAFMTESRGELNAKVFSFAVSIKDPKTNEIHTASSEDRQWAVVTSGQCAEAVFLPYPPWDLSKKGTYFGARLIKLFECQ